MAILMPLSKRILWSLLIKYYSGDKEIKEAYESNRKPLLLVFKDNSKQSGLFKIFPVCSQHTACFHKLCMHSEASV